MVDRAALEMQCTARYRGFESLSLRQVVFNLGDTWARGHGDTLTRGEPLSGQVDKVTSWQGKYKDTRTPRCAAPTSACGAREG